MADRKEFLTAEEVMDHLRLGRTFVYEQARLYLATDGAQGLPCRRFGRILRFPLDEIDRYAGTQRPTPPAPKRPPATRRRKRRPAGSDQPDLPFGA